MFDRQDDVVEHVIQQLRRPVGINPGLDARVMREIAQAPPTSRRVRPSSWTLCTESKGKGSSVRNTFAIGFR